MKSRFIVTATPELAGAALDELAQCASDLQQTREFRDGIVLVETSVPRDQFSKALVQADPVFVKHIMPAEAQVTLTGQRAHDLPVLLKAARSTCDIAPGERFSVQCRCVSVGIDYDYNAKDVEVHVGSAFEAQGAIPTFSDLRVQAAPSQRVVSVYLYADVGYVGCSTIKENLNEHCDEYRVFSRHPREISRAEFKLKEAIRKFGLDISGGRALDLGAAPGGWTKVLADAGMEVVAVDPAALDERVARLPTVTHVKGRAESHVLEGEFDLIVNDMNIDPESSARVMVDMAPHLKQGEAAIMTVKLVIRDAQKLLANVTPILDEAYRIVRIKNLFHNRREVTLLLERGP